AITCEDAQIRDSRSLAAKRACEGCARSSVATTFTLPPRSSSGTGRWSAPSTSGSKIAVIVFIRVASFGYLLILRVCDLRSQFETRRECPVGLWPIFSPNNFVRVPETPRNDFVPHHGFIWTAISLNELTTG